MSNEFIENLKEFNRKERYYVVAGATEGEFKLSEAFMKTLNEKLPINCKITDRKGAFVAMDYHLDWIYASLFLTANKGMEKQCYEMPEKIVEKGGLITASQEDVDLIVAYPDLEDPQKSHLIMIEAKGDTSWNNGQATSKAKRLKTIFEYDGVKKANVSPHYIIWSPKEPSDKLDTSAFPQWAKKDGKLCHIELKMPSNLKKVVRCNEQMKDDAAGKFWKIVNTSKSQTTSMEASE